LVPAALATGALVLEDIVAGACDERALFHLLNLAREDDAFVLLTSRLPPSAWKLAIRDLDSRIKALPIVSLAAPDDALLRAVLVKLFADRQIAVEENLIGYIATRIERSFAAARAIVRRLDAEAMRRKRPLTRALAGEILRSASA
jgi:chromosomal replication initiation ATPase DnaA